MFNPNYNAKKAAEGAALGVLIFAILRLFGPLVPIGVLFLLYYLNRH